MTRALLAAGLLVLLIGAAVALIARDRGEKGGPAGSGAEARAFTSSEECRACHTQVYEEWQASQHAFSYVNPLVRRADMTDGFRKKDCVPCHAPRPVFEHGLGKAARVLARDTNRFLGVDCLACHSTGGGMASARAGLRAPCAPVERQELTSTDLCAPCHNQHDTVDEWEASPPHLKGQSCLHCHMPPVERAPEAGRGAYTGSFHGSRGGNDLELLQKSATLACQVAGEEGARWLEVTVTNSGTAHHLPADARHRAVDLVVRLRGPGGEAVGEVVDLGPGEQGGSARLRFRNPYREEFGKVNTQIPSGEARTLVVPFDPAAARSAEVLLLYKRTPFVPDEEATVVIRRTLDL